MKYHFRIYYDEDYLVAQCIELEGCITQAKTLEELQLNMQDALNVYVDEPADSAYIAALPNDSIELSEDIVEVPLDPHIAFAFLVRYNRIKHGLTQQEAANKMGFETIYSYQRLETAKCNPTLKMLAKIKKLFPDFSIDYAVSV